MNNDWGCKVTPQAILAVKSHMNSLIYYRHKIEITDSATPQKVYIFRWL